MCVCMYKPILLINKYNKNKKKVNYDEIFIMINNNTNSYYL